MTGNSLLIVTHPVSKEIAKAQHGCIDCFAAMICVEVGTVGTECQPLATPANGEKKMRKLIEEIPEGGLRSRPKGSNFFSCLHQVWDFIVVYTNSEDFVLIVYLVTLSLLFNLIMAPHIYTLLIVDRHLNSLYHGPVRGVFDLNAIPFLLGDCGVSSLVCSNHHFFQFEMPY